MKKYLIVTEKLDPEMDYRDGGFRLIETLKKSLGQQADFVQFQEDSETISPFKFNYPNKHPNRFIRRIENAHYIAEKVRNIWESYTDIIFVHVSMLFGFSQLSRKGKTFWAFPMFLFPSYIHSGETPPSIYMEYEKAALKCSDKIISPSFFERTQIVKLYGISSEKIKIIPRGVDQRSFSYLSRKLNLAEKIIFCNLGSIKRQKNTLELIRIFSSIRERYPNSVLKLIGSVQDYLYAQEVEAEIEIKGLSPFVKFYGYTQKKQFQEVLSDVHFHLSTSNCETFGRAIFETLASGIPNICRKENNAAYSYLSHYPFARFYSNETDFLEILDQMVLHFETLSEMASEIGSVFDETMLGNLLGAELMNAEKIIVADFDGTIYYKNDAAKTKISCQEFNKYTRRAICSARPLNELYQLCQKLQIMPNYIIASSGSIITDDLGNVLWQHEISEEEQSSIELSIEDSQLKGICGQKIRNLPLNRQSTVSELKTRIEVYENKVFTYPWNISKLSAIQKLLGIIGWKGRVICFGDSLYDHDFLHFFDGFIMKNGKGYCKTLNSIQNIKYIP